jgi:hypothetical protein
MALCKEVPSVLEAFLYVCGTVLDQYVDFFQRAWASLKSTTVGDEILIRIAYATLLSLPVSFGVSDIAAMVDQSLLMLELEENKLVGRISEPLAAAACLRVCRSRLADWLVKQISSPWLVNADRGRILEKIIAFGLLRNFESIVPNAMLLAPAEWHMV